MMFRSIVFSAAAIAWIAGSVSAQACDFGPDSSATPVQWPKLPSSVRAFEAYDSIVGVWQVSLIVSGNVVNRLIDSWHSDGTEFVIADNSPLAGNVCAGVWKTTGARSYQIHHLGWTFDTSGNPTGSFVVDQSLTLNRTFTIYKGTFDSKYYDTSGNLVKEVSGDTSATRLAAP